MCARQGELHGLEVLRAAGHEMFLEARALGDVQRDMLSFLGVAEWRLGEEQVQSLGVPGADGKW